MSSRALVAAINPGSASTKIGLFEGDSGGEVVERGIRTIEHPEERLEKAGPIWDQLTLRHTAVEGALDELGIAAGDLAAAVGRGGLLPPLPGGTYRVDAAMIETLRRAERGDHASNLGAPLALQLVSSHGRPAFVVDPVSVDELEPVARVSGLPQLPRSSQSHALNIRASARRFARESGLAWERLRLVVAHLGSGVSLAVFRGGRMVDVINPRDEGPFSPERAGSVPVLPLTALCFTEGATREGLERLLFREGGLLAHLGTRDLRVVRRRIAEGDEKAALVLDAMAYQVAKAIGALTTVPAGELDGIILTGGLVRDEAFADDISRRVAFLAPVSVYPGEDELRALAEGAARVMAGLEEARPFPKEEREWTLSRD